MKIIQKIVGKIVNCLIVLVIIAIIICAYSVFSIKVLNKGYVNFFGYSIFEVATGSMKEEIDVGDAVLVKINDDFAVGDIVTYQSGEDYITHRVVSKNDGYIITKGDANNVNDNPIDEKLVLGKVVKIMPKVGIWKKVILTPKVIALILLTLFIFSILFSYDGNAIKIVASKKAQKEIDNKIEDEVNKKVAVMNRRKRRVKKVLDATQIIDLNEVKNQVSKPDKKNLEATQILDLDEIDNSIKQKEVKKEDIEVTQILDLDDIVDIKKAEDLKNNIEATQYLDLNEIDDKIKEVDVKQNNIEATQFLDLNEIDEKTKEVDVKQNNIEATQFLDLDEIENVVDISTNNRK